ncbi:MAG: hypothetical protein OXK21_08225 [Chloroflexota bacterium]|nr:hypothetical protein [Chloroflexota bacterium]
MMHALNRTLSAALAWVVGLVGALAMTAKVSFSASGRAQASPHASPARRLLGAPAGGSRRRFSGPHSLSGGAASSSALSSRKHTLPLLAALAAAALGLWLLLPGGALHAQQAGPIEYAENGTGPVATFTADDPEGATPIAWDIVTGGGDPDGDGALTATDNADSDHFTIDEDGMLKFSAPPDYENPSGEGATSNTYKVVVVACDVALEGDPLACPTDAQAGYHAVTVNVTNLAEDGKVTWTVDHDGDGADTPTLLQFQVGAVLTATVTDGDISGETKTVVDTHDDVPANPTWRWFRSPSKTATGTEIDGATTANYTVTTDDVGTYLRAVAYYLVAGNVDQETASLTSDYPVLVARAADQDNELKFSPAAVNRSVAEGRKGANVGAPVTATGNHGVVNYTLVDSGDAAAPNPKFEIDQKTGQITTLVDLDYDTADADNCRDADFCTVTVRATDASGDAAPGDATVTIRITDVNEKPTFTTGADAVSVAENSVEVRADSNNDDENTIDDDPNPYVAMDPEDLNLTYHLMGPDGAKFDLSDSRHLSFRTRPNYEIRADANGDNVYEVTVRASDGTTHADRMVRVTITDVNEAPDVMGVDSVNHPENSDDAVATFSAEDPEGSTSIAWSLATAAQISAEASLNDADNADAGDFVIDPEDGVLKFSIADANDGSSAGSPDFENPQGAGSPLNNTYNVVVAASDGATPTPNVGYHKVTVEVTDQNELGKVTWTVDPDGAGLLAASTVNAGNPIVQFQAGAVLTASATDGDIAGADKSVGASQTLTWRWRRGSAVISGQTSETYTVSTSDVGHHIRATATYRVGDNVNQEDASLISDYPVLAIRPSDKPNRLKFDPAAISREVAEGDMGANVGAPVTATDNHGVVNYTLVDSGDAASTNPKFKIDQKSGQITTLVDLNFDSTATANDNCAVLNMCVVTVRATDASGDATPGDATVTIRITDVNEKPEFVMDTTATPPAASPTAISVREGNISLVTAATPGSPTAEETAGVTFAATDPEDLHVNLTLMGPDGAKFQLSETGVLSFTAQPDYEVPGDANRDNIYEVTVRASDGRLNTDRMVRVTVTNVDEAPVIIAGGLLVTGPASIDYAEDRTDSVATYTALGPDAAFATWSLEGDDAGDFTLSNSGVLTFVSSPDYERPADADTDNVYTVTVTVTDSQGNSDDIDVTVTVTDVVEQTPSDPLLARFDPDGDGTIEAGDMRLAVADYFGPTPTISEADMRRLVGIYFQ